MRQVNIEKSYNYLHCGKRYEDTIIDYYSLYIRNVKQLSHLGAGHVASVTLKQFTTNVLSLYNVHQLVFIHLHFKALSLICFSDRLDAGQRSPGRSV